MHKTSSIIYRIFFLIIYPCIWLIAWLPLPALYILSDLFSFTTHYIIRYRLKTVRRNLSNAFPQKTPRQLRKIENQFYRHLCDYGFETIFMLHAGEKRIQKHIQFENTEVIEDLIQKGKSVIALFGHYGNWEYICSIPIFMKKNENLIIGTVYRHLKDVYFDRFFLKLRSKFGVQCIAKQSVFRNIVQIKKQGKQYLIAFIADQTPSVHNLHYWTSFLNQPTPFLTGWETIACKTNDAVVFLELKKNKRGHYSGHFETICENAAETKPYELTEKYARKMEKNILCAPEFWLWSHKRWKYKYEDCNRNTKL